MSVNTAALADRLYAATGKPCSIEKITPVPGGCIHRASLLQCRNGERFFLKSNSSEKCALFETEANALSAIRETGTIRVPRPILCEKIDDNAILVLEWIAFEGSSPASWTCAGQQLARLHQTSAQTFGWQEDNWIGSTPQINTTEPDWCVFFREHRLRYQLDRAAQNGIALHGGKTLLQQLPHLLQGHGPKPALIHGDLWSGNIGFCAGQPVIFDPAAHFADRECDLAMTRLFGGFPPEFYAAYESVWPLPQNASQRLPLYQLYPILNHANLFGGGYLQEAQIRIQNLLQRL